MARGHSAGTFVGGGGKEDLAVAEMAALMRFPLPDYHFTIASLPENTFSIPLKSKQMPEGFIYAR